MKKFTTLLAALLAVLMICTACAANNNPDGATTTDPAQTTDTPATDAPAVSPIEGDPLELVIDLVTDAKVEVMCENAELAADNVEWLLGLTADDYSANVEKGAISMAMMSAQAHMVALLECKDADAAKTVKEKLHTQFDIRRWVCVIPEMCYVIDSGNYVFFVASTVDYAEPLLEGFTTLAGGNVGERLDVEGATGKIEIEG
ncbi:MAG: DUF4358 domain-containing protein [Clostridia bacterium]|nr:DUF4358 domain-containing protein [Clostridia bacterium]